MRPRPLAAGFQFRGPGSVARAGNSPARASSSRDRLSAMPLAVTHLTNSRREGRMDTSWPALIRAPLAELLFLELNARPHGGMTRSTHRESIDRTFVSASRRDF